MNDKTTIPKIEPRYEEQFTVFVDFLGFREASSELDEATRTKVLELLKGLATLRSEFSAQTIVLPRGVKAQNVNPATSTFSDHIVFSFPLQSTQSYLGDERMSAFIILHGFQHLLAVVAAEALQIGFLIRGGATIGKLYHADGVIFGEALIEAVNLEERTAIYPRVVLSNRITKRSPEWTQSLYTLKDDDGICYVDYFRNMLFKSATPGTSTSEWNADMKSWLECVVPIIGGKLQEFEAKNKLNELAKWTWFAKRFRASLGKLPPEELKNLGMSIEALPFGRLDEA
jgi:hypothetical protein